MVSLPKGSYGASAAVGDKLLCLRERKPSPCQPVEAVLSRNNSRYAKIKEDPVYHRVRDGYCMKKCDISAFWWSMHRGDE